MVVDVLATRDQLLVVDRGGEKAPNIGIGEAGDHASAVSRAASNQRTSKVD